MVEDVEPKIEVPKVDETIAEEKKDDEEDDAEQVEGRFFLKKKLCALGLADVSFLLYFFFASKHRCFFSLLFTGIFFLVIRIAGVTPKILFCIFNKDIAN